MALSRSALLVVEPAVIEHVTRYLTEPKKRVAVSLDLASHLAPPQGSIAKTVALATGISARLDGVAHLAERARELGDRENAHDYARALWREIAFFAAVGGAQYHQGLGRSLGFLAHPDVHALGGTSKSTRHLIRAMRYLVKSTSTLTPELALPGSLDALPPWGGEELASGFVPAEFVAWLSELLTGEQWPLRPLATELFGPRSAEDWRQQVLMAATDAKRRRAHLLELDPSVLRACRRSSGRRTPSLRPAAICA